MNALMQLALAIWMFYYGYWQLGWVMLLLFGILNKLDEISKR